MSADSSTLGRMKPTIVFDWTVHIAITVVHAAAFASISWALVVGHTAVLPLLLVVLVSAWVFAIKPMRTLPREHREQLEAAQAAEDRWADMQRRGIVPGP